MSLKDPDAGVVSLECGETVTGDLIIGADGIHVSFSHHRGGSQPLTAAVPIRQECHR